MSKVINLTRAAPATAFNLANRVAQARAEVLRSTLVCTCAMALIAAGRALPFPLMP